MRSKGSQEVKIGQSTAHCPDPQAGSPTAHCAGSGPLLVSIAGLDGTGELFFKQLPRLADSYRVVTYRSREDGQFTYDDLADDVAGIIRGAGEEQATILGESFGGTVALNFALRYPQMVERLVIINSFPRFHSRVKIKLAARLASTLPPGVIWLARRAANTVGLFADDVSREDRRRFFEVIRTVAPKAYARRLQLISELNVEDRLSEIGAPTLLIAGEKDLLLPSAREARLMAARIPNAKVRVIKGAGHACLLGSRVCLAELLAE